MLSSALNIEEFIDAVKGEDFNNIIHLAELEATEAERLILRSRSGDEINDQNFEEYANTLKEFIYFLKYGVRSPDVNDYCWQIFLIACANLAEIMHVPPRCYGRVGYTKNTHIQ